MLPRIKTERNYGNGLKQHLRDWRWDITEECYGDHDLSCFMCSACASLASSLKCIFHMCNTALRHPQYLLKYFCYKLNEWYTLPKDHPLISLKLLKCGWRSSGPVEGNGGFAAGSCAYLEKILVFA